MSRKMLSRLTLCSIILTTPLFATTLSGQIKTNQVKATCPVPDSNNNITFVADQTYVDCDITGVNNVTVNHGATIDSSTINAKKISIFEANIIGHSDLKAKDSIYAEKSTFINTYFAQAKNITFQKGGLIIDSNFYASSQLKIYGRVTEQDQYTITNSTLDGYDTEFANAKGVFHDARFSGLNTTFNISTTYEGDSSIIMAGKSSSIDIFGLLRVIGQADIKMPSDANLTINAPEMELTHTAKVRATTITTDYLNVTAKSSISAKEMEATNINWSSSSYLSDSNVSNVEKYCYTTNASTYNGYQNLNLSGVETNLSANQFQGDDVSVTFSSYNSNAACDQTMPKLTTLPADWPKGQTKVR